MLMFILGMFVGGIIGVFASVLVSVRKDDTDDK